MARDNEFKTDLDDKEAREIRVAVASLDKSAAEIIRACIVFALPAILARPGLITLLQPGVLATRESQGTDRGI
jgi:hypothetical protein